MGYRSSLGDIAGTLVTAAQVTSDPYFAETVCRVGQLGAIKRGQAPSPCAKTPVGRPGGVGLGALMPALRGYVYAQQHPWAWAAAAAVAVGLPFLLGYAAGKGR